jgi:uridine kinase
VTGVGDGRTGLAPGDGAVVESFARLAERIRATAPRLGPVRLVAIDGPSGAGKTQFAARLSTAVKAGTPIPTDRPTGAAAVVHTDDLLDGWDDELTFWDRLEEQVLAPLRHGRPARYQRYLWHRKRFGGAAVTVAPTGVVLLEGVTAARAVIRPEVSLSVFVTAPPDLRLRRALVRDSVAASDGGVALRAYLERWRRVEDRHFAADDTAAHVDLIVDGAPRLPHDTADRYVRLVEGYE